jgi:cytochrome c
MAIATMRLEYRYTSHRQPPSTAFEESTMKSMFAAAITMAGLALATGARADAGADLAKSKNCLACHAVATKLVGPAYKDVATKYKGQKGAEDMLVQKVIKGGSGVWGPVAMPPNQVTEAEAHTLVKWVLAQK